MTWDYARPRLLPEGVLSLLDGLDADGLFFTVSEDLRRDAWPGGITPVYLAFGGVGRHGLEVSLVAQVRTGRPLNLTPLWRAGRGSGALLPLDKLVPLTPGAQELWLSSLAVCRLRGAA